MRATARITFTPKTIEQLLPSGFYYLGRVVSDSKKWWAACDELTGAAVMAETSRGLLEAVMKVRHGRRYDEHGLRVA